MRRHPSLRGLSADHHHALVLAHRARDTARDASATDLPDAVAHVLARFDSEVAPHFAFEESTLVLPLENVGEMALVERLVAEHRGIAEIVAALRSNATRASLIAFGEALERHVRFEERELFPRLETRLDAAALHALAAASVAREANALRERRRAESADSAQAH